MNNIADNILEIKNLSVGFYFEDKIEDRFFYAIENVSLNFERGKIHAIAGESGCGKSVLINSILRLLPKNAKISQGEIIYNNQNLINISDKDYRKLRGHKMFLIPQDPFMSLNPLYTIQNQIEEVNSDLDLIKKALDEVRINDIDNVLKSYPHELSGGMKQRIIIAMALLSNSELIFADEPTTALDASVSNSILDLLLNLKEKGKTIILITHDLSIVSNYCDSATVMYLGNIAETKASRELFKNPQHPYTRALLNALPNKRGKKLENIKGTISPVTEIIEGCKFHPRCNFAFEKCSKIRPELINSVACHLVNR